MKTLVKRSLIAKFLLAGFLLAQVANLGNVNAQVVNQAQQIPQVYPIPEQMELGPVLDVLPHVLSDGVTINLTVIPTLTEFVGYDNPNEVLSSGVLPQGSVLVPTVLPRFRVRQVVSTVNVWDGQTVVLGGLVSENVSNIRDKIPVLGDLPVLGRFFRSESKVARKSNLLIFITPTIIDPAGNRMHSDDELPFAQTAIPTQPRSGGLPE
ncbi:MAG TPA: hypothetical protein VI136_20385 [Verrucomicrobiae bacterium]